jgi:antitoxin component of MazEF toxin-antitoxin module
VRDILKVRKVGATLVVTLTQGVLEKVSLTEGDRVLIEALPPNRIIISKEQETVPNTRRVELELAILEARLGSLESQMTYEVSRYNNDGGIESSDLDHFIKFCQLEKDKVAVAIAEKQLELFDLAGAQQPARS